MLQHLSILYLDHLKMHYPDLLSKWQQTGILKEIIEQELHRVKPLMEQSAVDQIHPNDVLQRCLFELTEALPPSRFDYIKELLSIEFEVLHEQLLSSGLLPYESMNLIQHCEPVFEKLNFSLTNQDDRFIRYAVIAGISEYFERVQEQVSNDVQQSTTFNA